ETGRMRGTQERELVTAARLHVVTRRVATQHEPLARAGAAHEVERPDLARRAARETAEPVDRHAGLSRLPPDVLGQSLGELGRLDGALRRVRPRSAGGPPGPA